MQKDIAAHKVYRVWRNYRRTQLQDGDLLNAARFMETSDLAAMAKAIYEGR